MTDLYDKITENWEAWSNREYVLFQHLDSLYRAQRALSKIIAYRATNQINPEKPTGQEYVLWQEFFEPCTETVQRARIKGLKVKDEIKRRINESSESIIDGKRLTIKEYAELLFLIGCLYDQLGYSSPERKVTKSPFVSDLDTNIEMEA